MSAIREYFSLGFGALLLRDETYIKMRDDSQRLVKGLVLILLVGVITAALAIIGGALAWSVAPDLGAMKNIILEEMQKMEWFRAMSSNATAVQQFRQYYDLGWQIAGAVGGFNLINSITNVLLNPIMLVLRWVVFGFFAFIFARLFGGKGSLSQTLGCTALAVAPEMLGALRVFPNVEIPGIGIWGLVCTYIGVKTANQLGPWRAFWATLFPILLLIVTSVLVGWLSSALLASLIGGRP